jgi:hypothetical protein
MRAEPAGSRLPGPRPVDWNGAVMHRSMVLRWSLGGSDSGRALLGGASLPAGATRMLQHPQEDLAISSPPDLGLCERRICANSDGDDVVVPSRMTESGLPQ